MLDPLYNLDRLSPEEADKFTAKIADAIVKRHLAAPAIVLLESSKPLSFAASQLMLFFDPVINMIGGIKDYPKFQKLIEDRNNIERLITAIEKREDELIQKKKVKKDEKRGD